MGTLSGKAGKPLTPEQIAAMIERKRRAERKANLEAMLREQGIPVKTPEQKAAERLCREQDRAANPPPPLIRSTPTVWEVDLVRKHSGPYADTVIAFARADRARSWACDGIDRKGNATRNPSIVILFAMGLHIEQLWRDAGIIRYDRCVLDNLKGDSRCEVEQVIADTFAEWEAAGSPGLDAKAYEVARRFLHGFIWNRSLPPYPNCPAPSHPTGIFPEWEPCPA